MISRLQMYSKFVLSKSFLFNQILKLVGKWPMANCYVFQAMLHTHVEMEDTRDRALPTKYNCALILPARFCSFYPPNMYVFGCMEPNEEGM